MSPTARSTSPAGFACGANPVAPSSMTTMKGITEKGACTGSDRSSLATARGSRTRRTSARPPNTTDREAATRHRASATPPGQP